MNKMTTKKLIAFGKNNQRYNFSIKKRYEYIYKREKLSVEIVEEPDGFTVIRCNGVRYPVEIVSQHQNNYEILVNGVSYSFSVETPFSLYRSKLLASLNPNGASERIVSPMPGKVLDVMVEQGQEVQPGDALLVLEAMKMQNSIQSTVKGVVTKINVAKDASVAKGDLLIEVEG